MADTPYVIQQFDKALHDRKAFSCGVTGMDRWFKKSISEQIKHNRLRVWCAVDRHGVVVGFYGLSAHSVEPENAPALQTKGERRPIPAIYLVALATDDRQRGRGLGCALMADAIAKALDVSETIGAAAIILDVLKDDNFDRRMAFYRRIGFEQIDEVNAPARLFLSLKWAAASKSNQ